MARKNRTPEENARREKIRELLQMANIGSMDDIQNLFKETIAEFMENGLEAELDDELGYSKYDYKNKDTDNSRNGHSSKTLRTSFGDVDVSVPRDRKGEFEPQVLKKNQTSISQDIEEKILSMYAKGMTTSDIETHIRDIYGISVSDSTVSRITDKILPIAKEWQQRPLEPIYAASGTYLRRGISGCNPLPCPQRGADCEESGLHCDRSQSGWRERCSGDVGWRKRERQVLGDCTQQPEKPRDRRHFHRLYRQFDRV